VAPLNRDFWRGRRVLVTGHTGFKGAWTAIWLAEAGAAVTGLALPPDQDPSLYELAGVEALMTSRFADLRDPKAVEAALGDEPFDLVLHMAAQPIVRTAIAEPLETFDTNLMGTGNLLATLQGRSGLQAVLTVTSDKVYANDGSGRAFEEADPLGGKDPYSQSKAAAEMLVRGYARAFFEPAGVPLATARGGNVVGGGDAGAERLIPDIVRAARAGQGAVLRHPEATRPWQHVLDAVAGYLAFLEALAERGSETPRALNFGPPAGGAQMTVGEAASLFGEALGAPPWRHEPDPSSIEAVALDIDPSRAKAALGFAARLSPREAMLWTADWHRRQAAGEDALALCRAQIAAYEARP
jgi:CDP-glucose 4,6-dehydratase